MEEQPTASLADLRAQLTRIEAALAKKNDPDKVSELKLLKAKAEATVKTAEDLEKLRNYQWQTISRSMIGRKCNVYDEEGRAWLLGEVVSIDVEAQTASVKLLGLTATRVVPATFLQLLKGPENLTVGTSVDVLSEDGRWYTANVEEVVSATSYKVKYERWKTDEIVSHDCLRLSTQQKLIDKEVFEVPENLRILPNDPEEVRNSKKKRVKGLMKAWRRRKQQKESEIYLAPWKNFKRKGREMAWVKDLS